jgi:low affinity Fe/Cu permease
MVFLIQHTQNTDTEALHLKLDELIRSRHQARDSLMDLVRNNRSNWRVSRHAALLTADIRREALVSYRVL